VPKVRALLQPAGASVQLLRAGDCDRAVYRNRLHLRPATDDRRVPRAWCPMKAGKEGA